MIKGFAKNAVQKLKTSAVEKRKEIEDCCMLEDETHYIFVFGNIDNGLKRLQKTKEEYNVLYHNFVSNAKLDAHKPEHLYLANGFKCFGEHLQRHQKKSLMGKSVMFGNNYFVRIEKNISPEFFRKSAEHAFSTDENAVKWQLLTNLIF